jgi:hypothetical protein
MRIDQTLDALQGQASLHQRVTPPPAVSPPRRVQAIGQAQEGEEQTNVAAAPPDDAIMLDLSPEGREAARKAALEQLQKQLMGQREETTPESQAMTPDERRVDELRRRDREARAREQALRAAAGSLSSGGASYSYQVGPDGRLYVVDSQVELDTSEVPGDPEATLRKAEQLQRAALVAGNASPQDGAVAAMAAMMAARARQEMQEEQKEDEGRT